MTVKHKKLIFATVVALIGFGLVGATSTWLTALGLYLVVWGNNMGFKARDDR